LKDVDPRVFTRILWMEGRTDGRKDGRKEGRKEGRTDGSITISLRNFVGEGIIKQQWTIEEISIF
jgi:predicted transposase YdaD